MTVRFAQPDPRPSNNHAAECLANRIMTQKTPTVEGSKGRVVWRGFRWLGLALGAFAVGFGARTAAPAVAREVDQSSTAVEVQATWQDFAKRLQLQFQARLTSDDEPALSFHQAMSKLVQASGTTSPAMVVRVWLMPDGKIERLELEGLKGDDALRELYAVLRDDSVGAPPADMPQPVRLRFSLVPKTRTED
jgi:hypothetical protein